MAIYCPPGLQTQGAQPGYVNTWQAESGAHNSAGDHGSHGAAPVCVHLHEKTHTCLDLHTHIHTHRHPRTRPNLPAEAQPIAEEPDLSHQIITAVIKYLLYARNLARGPTRKSPSLTSGTKQKQTVTLSYSQTGPAHGHVSLWGNSAGLLLIKTFSPTGDALNGTENKRETLGIKYITGNDN